MTSTDAARGLVLDDRYRIDAVLGVGGMATVYRAADEVLGREVAIKLFPATASEDERQRQQAEISLLAALSHPGLVTLLDAGSCFAGGPTPQTYIVMELVAGPTLADLLRTGPLSQAATAVIGRQLAEALSVVHAGNVVHRDVKPANVLFTEELRDDGVPPQVKLTDFGIARALDAARLTMTGLTMGTATYLSPEQASGSAVGPPTDVYALGLVLLECLTGQKAFTGSVVEVAAARLTTSPAIPTSLGPAWGALLSGMTRRRPDERLGLGEVARRLDDLAAAATEEVGDHTLVLQAVPEADAGVDDRAGAAPGAAAAGSTGRVVARWRLAERPGGRRRVLEVATVALVVLGVVLAVLLPGTAPAPASPALPSPQVSGPLGAALSDLVESVQP